MAKRDQRTDPGAGDRRRQARAAQQAATAKAKRRRTLTQVGIVGGVLVVVVAIITTAVVLGTRGSSDAAAPRQDTTITLDGARVPLATTSSGVRIGPDDAKVAIDLWVDFSCPYCQAFEAANSANLSSLVAGGNVSVTTHTIHIDTDYAVNGGSTAACVAVHDPELWPNLNAALYANHSSETDDWSLAQFRSFAADAGAGAESQTCITDGRYRDWITQNTAASVQAGVKGTPTMFIDGKQVETLTGQALTDRVNQLRDA